MEMREVIIRLITGPEGYNVDLFGGLLCLGRMEDGLYRIARYDERGQMTFEAIFLEADNAVDEFLKKRNALQLGYDYERPISS